MCQYVQCHKMYVFFVSFPLFFLKDEKNERDYISIVHFVTLLTTSIYTDACFSNIYYLFCSQTPPPFASLSFPTNFHPFSLFRTLFLSYPLSFPAFHLPQLYKLVSTPTCRFLRTCYNTAWPPCIVLLYNFSAPNEPCVYFYIHSFTNLYFIYMKRRNNIIL